GPGHSENPFHQFGAPRPHQAGNAENLASLDLETDIAKSFSAQVLNIKENRTLIGGFLMKHIGKRPANHLFDKHPVSQMGGCISADVLAITKNRDLIGYLEDFIHFMADIDDPAPLCLQ